MSSSKASDNSMVSNDEIEKQGSKEKMSSTTRIIVWAAFGLYILARIFNKVFFRLASLGMQARPAYNVMMSLYCSIGVQLVWFPVICCYILYKRRKDKRYNWRFLLPSAEMASEKPVVWWKYIGLVLFDQLMDFFQAIPSPYISAAMSQILNRFTLVFTVLFSIILLKTRFHGVHYVACLLVIVASVVGVTSKLENLTCSGDPSTCISAYKAADGKYYYLTGGVMLLWYVMFILGNVPSALDNVYKQWALKDMNWDIVHAMWISGFWKILICFCTMIPLMWIPLPGQEYVPISETGTIFRNAWTCFLGKSPNVEEVSCSSTNLAPIGYFVLLLCCNLPYNFLMFFLIKRMSGVWMSIGSALAGDVFAVVSQFHFLMGKSAALMTIGEWMGTVLTTIAVYVYNMIDEKKKDGTNVYLSASSVKAEQEEKLQA